MPYFVCFDRLHAEDERLRREMLYQHARETAYREYCEQNTHSKMEQLATTQRLQAGVL